jgi:hypothetical protein
MGIDKDQIIKSFGYDGIMTTNMKLTQKNEEIPINSTESSNNKKLLNTDANTNPEVVSTQVRTNPSISTDNNPTSDKTIPNPNTISSSNNPKLPSIEEEKQEEGQYLDESQLLSLLHVFVKNLEAQGITKEKINQKIEDICKIFENKEEATKEEFIEPFVKMFVETMKITKEKDIEVVNNFLSDFVDSLMGKL